MINQAISLLKNNSHLVLSNESLHKGNGLKHFFCPSFHRQEVRKVIAFAESRILNAIPETRKDFLPLGDALIQRYHSDCSVANIVKAFDRQIAPFRSQLCYLHPANQRALQKWEKASQPIEIFRDYPRFTKFLESSMLLSQIKVTRDTVRIIEGEPALLVEGEWVKEPDLYRRFEILYSKFYDQKFLVEKETREVFSYLDNGRGLEKHHPFLSTMSPISTLNEADYLRTWIKACEFIRPEERNLTLEQRAERNQNRPFILQYVTSRVQEGNTNFDQLIRNAKHPYLRMIVGQDNPDLGTKKGEVYETGYGWKEVPLLPFVATKGRFRSPDLWEFKSAGERIVTNIPLSQEEARQFYQFTLKYHRDGVHFGIEPGFNLTRQNCSVYTREACKAAGIHIPTEIDFKAAIDRVTPECIRKVGHQLRAWAKASTTWLQKAAKRFIPETVFKAVASAGSKIVHLIEKVRDAFIAFILTPIRVLLGSAFGKGGAAFRQFHERPTEIRPLNNLRSFFDLSSYKLNLPVIAQKWQLEQPSTVIYKCPIKLAIVP